MLKREILSGEHAAMDALAADLVRCVAADGPDLEQAGRLRWRLSRVLAAHLAKEDALLYPRLHASRDPHVVATVGRLVREMGGLAAVWGRYLKEWPAPRIEAEWPTFAGETRAVMAALRARIAEEETHLYPLLDRA